MSSILSAEESKQDAASMQPRNLYPGASVPYQEGWRLYVVLFLLFLGLFLSTLETTIIATALVAISSDLGDFARSSWIPVSYLLAYTGFLIITARLSDVFGRKQVLIGSVVTFMVASAACGAAHTMDQLIVFRALQGAGGGGIYSSVMGSLREVSPPTYYGPVSGVLGVVFALSSVIGPVLGGLIVSHTTWRWVFLLNLPGGLILIVLAAFFFPSNVIPPSHTQHRLSKLRQIDYLGFCLCLAASSCLIYALEKASLSFTWRDPITIALLTSSAYLWIIFMMWQVHLSSRANSGITSSSAILPVLPLRILRHRIVGAAIVAGFLSGFTFFVVIVNLPQRFQIQNSLSATEAGVRLIPFLLSSAFGAGLTGWVCGKKAIDSYVLCFACALQIVALGLLSTLSSGEEIRPIVYGIEALLGFGTGSLNTCIIVVSRVTVEGKDQVAIAAITQFRTLGGIIGLALSQFILFDSLLDNLSPTASTSPSTSTITAAQITTFLNAPSSLSSLPPASASQLRAAYGIAANKQIRAIMWFAVAAFVACLATLRRDAVTFEEKNRLLMVKVRDEEELMGVRVENVEANEVEESAGKAVEEITRAKGDDTMLVGPLSEVGDADPIVGEQLKM